ncbi:hypothetical protein AM501_09725 [Aneurinibacillus migulanus]|uniref:hypothetical protein n=1 Tax=Aneurinibacillus migulanus TaxID=47500 RepID=UPI0005B9228F|nr:hypothetical protein [Aneurinibacillus migulanus]KIV56425.1 hypothetical protein TS64_09140 [Aneurinibacillus migulanus]KPD08433.1 hypothetical protein AM501_09725 [Aneurinibacillus migulanus]
MNMFAAVQESQTYKNVYFLFYRRRLFPVKRLPLDRRQRKNVRYPNISNGTKNFEFLLLSNGKVSGRVYVGNSGEMTDDLKEDQ